ncbi:MAG: lipocalin family protein [Nitrospina sp.]|nr:lipocalin family protein [Nitrospina sp.]
MKKFFILLTIYLILINPLTVGSVFPLENKKLEVVSNLDLQKFQGTWYEIAHNPWFPEKGCFSMIAHYKLTDDNQINVTNICRKNGFDGEISKVTGRAWLVNPKIKAKWEVQFIWPFTLDYWVIDLEENYNYAVIGEPEKENLWILSRKPIIEKGILSKIIENTKIKGYDLSNLILTPQDPLYSKCLAQWVEDIDKQQVALTC